MKKTRPHARRRATALAFTLVITACLTVIAASALTIANQEHKLTQRRIVIREASNAAEAAINYGIAQIIQLTSANQFVTSDFLNPKFGHALPTSPPKSAIAAGGLAGISANQISLLGGMADPPAGSTAFMISTGNPTSSTDSCKGMVVHAKTVPLLTSVTVPVPGGDPVQVYAKAHVMVRDAALFNYAMFYGQDIPLGLHPGSSMLITGNIRGNSDIYIGGAGGRVTVLGTVFSSGSINYGRLPTSKIANTMNVSHYFPRVDTNGNGKFDNQNGWTYDETRTGSAFFNGGSATAELINNFVTTAAGVAGNLAANADWEKLFPDASGNFNADGTPKHDWTNLAAAQKAELKKQLWSTYSTKLTNGAMQDSANGVLPIVPAGLDAVSSTTPAPGSYDAWIEACTVAIANKTALPKPDHAPAEGDAYDAWVNSTNRGGALIAPPLKSSDSGYNADVESSKFSNKAGMYIVADREGKTIAFGKASDAAEYLAEPAGTARDAWVDGHRAKVLDLVKEGVVTPPLAVDEKGNNTQAFYDTQQKKAVRAVDVDLGKLRTFVSGTPTYADGKTTYTMNPTPGAPGWNGIVYVHVENPTQTETVNYTDASDTQTSMSSELTAVRVTNAKEVPDRAVTNLGDGTKGFTLATNAPVYSVGSVNADGNTAGDSGSMPDSGDIKNLGNETAVCLAGDSYSTLSANWNNAKSFPGFPRGDAVDTEISAAIIAGVVTAKTGVEGSAFPRLLESWGNSIISNRGSQVALFQSRYATAGDNATYGVPKRRQYGLAEVFRNGIYPPGTPMLRSYRRMNFRLISKAEYNAEKKAEWIQPDKSTTAKFPW